MTEVISVIGLGYVGLPLAVAFSEKLDVIGYDIDSDKINLYKQGIDPTKEVGNDKVKDSSIKFTDKIQDIKEANIHIVAVPTPINKDKTPNLIPLKSASKDLGKNLKKGDIIIYESTVYPGVTEEICVPILEKESSLKLGEDFKVAYSPERINPGDNIHKLENIVKVVSASDDESLNKVANLYRKVVDAGVYKAESIKVAEAAKVIENTQRDINIAFMNELSIIFNQLGIDTKSVLEASNTKWNFLNFHPGLVGGHCIGVDPYYLTYKAKDIGYHPEIILSGRKINDYMGKYVAENLVKLMIKENKAIRGAKVGILGITFKENCPDVRNTKVVDIISELKEYGIESMVYDPQANKDEVMREYGIKLVDYNDLKQLDSIILAVPHDEFNEIDIKRYKSMYNNKYLFINGDFQKKRKVFIDVKGALDKELMVKNNFAYWRL